MESWEKVRGVGHVNGDRGGLRMGVDNIVGTIVSWHELGSAMMTFCLVVSLTIYSRLHNNTESQSEKKHRVRLANNRLSV